MIHSSKRRDKRCIRAYISHPNSLFGFKLFGVLVTESLTEVSIILKAFLIVFKELYNLRVMFLHISALVLLNHSPDFLWLAFQAKGHQHVANSIVDSIEEDSEIESFLAIGS